MNDTLPFQLHSYFVHTGIVLKVLSVFRKKKKHSRLLENVSPLNKNAFSADYSKQN
jgi:hypothetical protein